MNTVQKFVWFTVFLVYSICGNNEIYRIETDGPASSSSSSSVSSTTSASSSPPIVSSMVTAALTNITRLQEAIAEPTVSSSTKLQLLEELADIYSRIHYYQDSIRVRQDYLQLKQQQINKQQRQRSKKDKTVSSNTVTDMGATNVMNLVKQYVSLAQDYKDTIQYDEALDILRTAQNIVTTNPSGSQSYPDLLPLLYRMEATMLDCKGEDVNALGKFTRAKKLALQNDPNYRVPLSDTLQHIRLLQKIITSSSIGQAKIPVPIYQGIKKEYERQVSGLLATGPWIHPQQLPKVFVPGLTSLPWHTWSSTHWSHLGKVAETLIAAHADLLLDLQSLQTNNHLDRETECIHDAYSGGWRFHMLNGYWIPKDEQGCSVYAPRACALLQRIARLNLPNFQVIRGGFSLIDRAAHLKPHFGLTNAQLKFHLGLIVPMFGNGTACAHLRVGNETRAWQEKEILFFDDSYEHEVWNHCGTERAVFQLVFAHPDLTTNQRETMFAKALQESH